MGWLYSESWPTASAMRDHLRDELKASGYEIVKDALVAYGRRYYAAVKFVGTEADRASLAATLDDRLGKTTIFMALLSKTSFGYGSTGWGYKDMSETMGPSDVDCPLSVLDAADPIDVAYSDWPDTPDGGRAWARGWREKVRAYWAKKAASRAAAKTLKIGDVVNVTGAMGNPFTIVDIGKATGKIYATSDGYPYRVRLPKTRIELLEAS